MSKTGRRANYRPIGAYAIVGDCHSAALVSDRGSVDWFCPVRFDAPAVFCRLLDARRGGYLSIAPQGGDFDASRRYLGTSNVLETTFDLASGRVRLLDFMPVRPRAFRTSGADVEPTHQLLRRVEAEGGDVEVEIRFKPSFDYALTAAQLHVAADKGLLAQRAEGSPRLRAETWTSPAGGRPDGDWTRNDAAAWLALSAPGVQLHVRGDEARGVLRLKSGERCWIALRAGGPDDDPATLLEHAADDADDLLDGTIKYWNAWASHCTYNGPYRDEVLRSALALKLLNYAPSGAIVAAPTTSLPEAIGGPRNWDYRFCWLRDSSLILYALMTVGFHTEAAAAFQWLGRAAGPNRNTPPSILYTIDARQAGGERLLGHLAGYRESRPVRIGNAAAAQRQLDIYGEVLTAAELFYQPSGALPEGEAQEVGDPDWALLKGLVDQAMKHWREPDQGIWEVRGPPRDFLFSKLMCWAAVDRGIRLARGRGLDAPLDDWRACRDEIRATILERGYNDDIGAFTQSFGSAVLDASALQIPRIGFLPATDPRVRSTIDRIRGALMHDGLLHRYKTHEADDGLPGGEGTFALCTLWLVDALALGGEVDPAQDLFERVLDCANDLGLLSEEIAPRSGALLGNFPQGFSHLSIIRSAVNLAKASKHGAEQEPQTDAQRAGPAKQAAQEGHGAPARRS